MTRKTRLFIMIAGGVLVVGLSVGLVASFLGLPAIALGGPDGPADLKYLPADTRLVAYADVRDLMSSEFRQQLRAHQPAPSPQHDIQAQTGIDPETDIDSVVVSFAGTGSEVQGEKALVLARGRFDQVRIENLVRERGGQASDYKGIRVLRLPEEDGPEPAVAFLEPGLIGFGSATSVEHAIDLAGGGLSITANDEVMGLVRGIRGGNVWAVGRFDAIAARARLPRDMADRLPPISWFSASGRVDSGLEGVLRVEGRDEEAARNLRDVVQGFLALTRLQAGHGPGLDTVIDSLQLSGEGKTVTLEFAVPASAVGALASELPRPQRGVQMQRKPTEVAPDSR